jgi:arylamine N-acetyltransferase
MADDSTSISWELTVQLFKQLGGRAGSRWIRQRASFVQISVDCLRQLRENVRRLPFENLDKITGCCITTLHCLTSCFITEFFYQKQHNSRHQPILLFCLPLLKIKLKGRHFDKTEVNDAESRAELNTFTEHDFLNTVKKWQNHWELCIRAERNYFESDGGQ